MGNSIFPSTPRYSPKISKIPTFKTASQEAASGRELRASLAAYPVYRFTLAYDLLRQDLANDELRILMGFFLQRRGRFDSFLFTDPNDSTVIDESFGTANGALTQFQLTREFGGFAEPIENVNTIAGIELNGTAVGISFTVGSTGIVTFSSAPSAGLLTWTGSYYYRCRFMSDENEWNQFVWQLWQMGKLELKGAVGNKI